MLSKQFIPWQRSDNWYGINAKDNFENMLDSELDENSINVCSDPQGALCSRNGYSALTTASIGTANAWCGFTQFRKHSAGVSTDYFLGGTSDAKLYQYSANNYNLLFSSVTGVTITADSRFNFFTMDNICVATYGGLPLKWTGSGSAATLGGTIVTADFGIEWQRYGFFHSTLDPRLMYYCTTLGSLESGYTSFLNYDEDPYEITGACKQGDDLIVGKSWSLFRTQYLGTSPIFKKYRIPANVGPVNHQVMKQTTDGKLLFLSSDFNVYMLVGDTVIKVGDNIQKILKAGVNSRLKYAVAGLLQSKSQYWISFTYTSGATANDRTIVMDYSRPYQDKWGKLQYPWFIYSVGVNCFSEIYTSGSSYLYHGGYTGLMYKDDTGTNDNGSAFNAIAKTKMFSFGDITLEKKLSKLFLTFANKGSHNLNISIVMDDNANTEKIIAQSMSGGTGYNTLWDVGKWDVDYWSSETDADIGRDIDRSGKTAQLTFSTTGLDESWIVYSYTLLLKLLRRGVTRTRES